jgi:hypothetical protein
LGNWRAGGFGELIGGASFLVILIGGFVAAILCLIRVGFDAIEEISIAAEGLFRI